MLSPGDVDPRHRHHVDRSPRAVQQCGVAEGLGDGDGLLCQRLVPVERGGERVDVQRVEDHGGEGAAVPQPECHRQAGVRQSQATVVGPRVEQFECQPGEQASAIGAVVGLEGVERSLQCHHPLGVHPPGRAEETPAVGQHRSHQEGGRADGTSL
jgi:hypothetical protein